MDLISNGIINFVPEPRMDRIMQIENMSRRQFLITTAASALSVHPFHPQARADASKKYQRANTDWLANCRYGMSVHWTAQSVPRHGQPVPFQKAVDEFPVQAFVDMVARTGSDYLMFTATHGLQMLPAPHPVIDGILGGRTCQRDLIGELADALEKRGIYFLLYYNHSCNVKQDSEWEKAVGYHEGNKDRFVSNLFEIVGWMGEQYNKKVKAWWFDSSYSLDPRGPVNSVTTEMTGFQFPWERYTKVAKRGYPDRLISYNAGVNEHFRYTEHQDYWAGEMNDLKTPATARYLEGKLQWFGWTCLNASEWVHSQIDAEMPPSHYSDQEVADFVRTCNSHLAPMTFNLGVYQDGVIEPASVEQLHQLGNRLPVRRRRVR